jgi:hypothetical protein
MGEDEALHHSYQINTRVRYAEGSNVETQMAALRRHIQERIQTSFDTLPEGKTPDFSLKKYIAENPQSVIFVPEKDMNMFPVVIEEAKVFARQFDKTGKSEKELNEMRDHELEHVQSAYGSGVDYNGVGFVLLKHDDKPEFAGFVSFPEDQQLDLKDELRLNLAPKTLSVDDKTDSVRRFERALANARTPEEVEKIISGTLLVLSERYLPKKVHSLLQKVIK